MKRFNYNCSTVTKVLLIIALATGVAGTVLNVINFINFFGINVLQTIVYGLAIICTVLLNVFAVLVLFFSSYVIDENNLTLNVGFIKNKTPLKDIIAITLFKKSNKLVVYFADQKYTVIVIDPTKYDEFILELRSKNNKIVYNTQIDGEDTPN